MSFLPYTFGHGYAMYLVTEISSSICAVVTEMAYLVQVDSLFTEQRKIHSRLKGLYTLILDFDMFGPAISGIMYYEFGQKLPFLCLTVIGIFATIIYMAFGSGCPGKIVNQPEDSVEQSALQQQTNDTTSYKKLATDSSILFLSFIIILIGLPKTMMTTTISVWIMSIFDGNAATVGLSYLPGFFVCLVMICLTDKTVTKWPDTQLILLISFALLDGLSIIILPFLRSIYAFVVTLTIMLSSSTTLRYILFPQIGIKAEKFYGIRDSGHLRGWEYIIGEMPFIIGPLLSTLFECWGLKIIVGIGAIHICILPLIYFQNPFGQESKLKREYMINPTYSVITTKPVQITFPIRTKRK